MSRSVKTAQIGMRELLVSIADSAGTPAAAGPDKYGITSVTDLGVGNYLLILKSPASNSKDLFLKGWSGPADTAVAATAIAFDRITIQVTDLANVAKDADVSLTIGVQDSRYEV